MPKNHWHRQPEAPLLAYEQQQNQRKTDNKYAVSLPFPNPCPCFPNEKGMGKKHTKEKERKKKRERKSTKKQTKFIPKKGRSTQPTVAAASFSTISRLKQRISNPTKHNTNLSIQGSRARPAQNPAAYSPKQKPIWQETVSDRA